MARRIKIIVVDDNEVFLEGLSSYLHTQPDYHIIAQFTSGIELLNYSRSGLADIIILDIEMPVINGVETAKQLNQRWPHVKLMAVTMYQDKIYLSQLVEAGFKTFVNKADLPMGLFEAIETALSDKYNFPKDLRLQSGH